LSSSTDARYAIGYISRAHALKGEVVVVSESPDDRFAAGSWFSTDHNERLTVTGYRIGKHGRIVQFDEISGRDEAEELKGRTLYISADQRRTLEPSEFWPEDLVGLDVVDEQGTPVGQIERVEIGTAQDRLVIRAQEGVVEIPFVDPLVPDVDLEARRVTVRLIAGLLSSE